jgi:hypothetical protein
MLDENIDQQSAEVQGDFSEDFVNTYGNRGRFEASAWDLKFIVGQLDQSSGTPNS